MPQLRGFSACLHSNRNSLLTLLIWLLLGSLLGAFCVSFCECRIAQDNVFWSGRGSPLFAISRALLFPLLLTTVALLHRRRLLCVLFFCKGFFVAFALCLCAVSGSEPLAALLPGLILETFLPLPALLLMGSLWFEDAFSDRIRLRALLPGLLTIFAALLTERLIS